MNISKLQSELVLRNLRERMGVKIKRNTGEEFCKVSVRLTSTELVAFDLALNLLKLSLANEIVSNKLEKNKEVISGDV